MSEKLTIILHIFNDEYLLPFWLEQHKQIFDHGIIIDYYSTDRSIEIINKYCPTWEIIKSKNFKPDEIPNIQQRLVDLETNEITKKITGYTICLEINDFFFITTSKRDIIKYLSKNKHYNINIYCYVNTDSYIFFPKNTIELFQNIDLFGNTAIMTQRENRILHSNLDYEINEINDKNNNSIDTDKNNLLNNDLFFIINIDSYPYNHKILEKKNQITKNTYPIPHIHDDNNLIKKKSNKFLKYIKQHIDIACEELKKGNIYYSELVIDSNWGNDSVILDQDVNLLKNTDFDKSGYKIIDIDNFNEQLQRFLINKIKETTNKEIELKNYHNEITDIEHNKILNTMPYKKDINSNIQTFSNYLEKIISEILDEPVKIFNEDLWFRICRPSNICNNDYNPCHRDIYLDFYRNIVNIYLPVIGSNENSSLTIQPRSHKWNENETMVTKGGAFFKYQNKKYSVDAIVASKETLEMIRPNPNENQLMLFSPYLIHGCANNDNENTTRISLEVRFIRNDENGRKQEAEFNEFLKIRNWR